MQVSVVSTDDLATAEYDARSGVAVQGAPLKNGESIGRSRILSHSVRLLELKSSSPIFACSLASDRRSSSSAFFCSSTVHSSKYLSRHSGLPLEYPVITFCLNSTSKSSCFFGLKLGSLLKNSHASLFFIWKRCFYSTRVLQNSRFRRSSSGLLLTSCCLIEASSLPVALTKRLSVSSSIAALSWARVVDLGGAPRTFP